jgi:hypothetical protein
MGNMDEYKTLNTYRFLKGKKQENSKDHNTDHGG